MKNGYIRLLIVCFIFILLLILNSIFNILNVYSFIIFLAVVLVISFYILGYEKNNHRYQKDIILTVLIYSIIYIIITNVVGIFIGFNKTGYSLKILSIVKNIIPVILIIILSELIRYTIITKGSKYKTICVLTLFAFVLLDITLIINRYNFKMLDELINFVIAIVLPSISRNIMLNYLTDKVGYKPGILYRFISELPLFFSPIFPDFGMYVSSILNIISPLILLYIIYSNFEKVKSKKVIIKKLKFNSEIISIVIFSIIILAIVALSSRWFKYYFLTIGSESMAKTINKGDIIIAKKLNNEEMKSLKEGDILIFNYSERIIVHRIIRIFKNQNNYYFYTKGDNNETEDGRPVIREEIIGITTLKIPYVGYPSVWLNELINKYKL